MNVIRSLLIRRDDVIVPAFLFLEDALLDCVPAKVVTVQFRPVENDPGQRFMYPLEFIMEGHKRARSLLSLMVVAVEEYSVFTTPQRIKEHRLLFISLLLS